MPPLSRTHVCSRMVFSAGLDEGRATLPLPVQANARYLQKLPSVTLQGFFEVFWQSVVGPSGVVLPAQLRLMVLPRV